MNRTANACRLSADILEGTDNLRSLLLEAADEIERLQKLCDLWVPSNKTQSSHFNNKEVSSWSHKSKRGSAS